MLASRATCLRPLVLNDLAAISKGLAVRRDLHPLARVRRCAERLDRDLQGAGRGLGSDHCLHDLLRDLAGPVLGTAASRAASVSGCEPPRAA
eukprot:14624632-Heterocapsa_arctica.AAC.1